MADFVGTWERVKTENMDAFLEAIGIPEQGRKVVEKKETLIIANEGDIWKTRYIFEDKEQNASFKIGEPSDYMSAFGKTITGTILSVGDRMVEEYLLDNYRLPVTRDIVDGQMCMTITSNGVTCKCWFDRK